MNKKTKSVLTAAERGDDAVRQKYELMFILSPILTEDKRAKAVAELESLIKSFGGEVFHVDEWGKRDLAYKIKKFTEGYYMIYYFMLTDKAKIKDIDQHLRLDAAFLRHLLIKREDSYEIKDFTQEETEEAVHKPKFEKKKKDTAE